MFRLWLASPGALAAWSLPHFLGRPVVGADGAGHVTRQFATERTIAEAGEEIDGIVRSDPLRPEGL